MKKECCKNCMYCHELKQLVNKEWKYSDCCVVWTKVRGEDVNPDDYDSFVLVVEPNEICELYAERMV